MAEQNVKIVAVAPTSADETNRQLLATATRKVMELRGRGAQAEIEQGDALAHVKANGYYKPDHASFTGYVKAAFAYYDANKLLRLATMAGHTVIRKHYVALGYTRAYALFSSKVVVTEALAAQAASMTVDQIKEMLKAPVNLTELETLVDQKKRLQKQLDGVKTRISEIDNRIKELVKEQATAATAATK